VSALGKVTTLVTKQTYSRCVGSTEVRKPSVAGYDHSNL
jgi:hypothetical protein